MIVFSFIDLSGNRTQISEIQVTQSGPWSSATAYIPLVAVTYSGASYICLTAHTNQVPTVLNPYWSPLVIIDTTTGGPLPGVLQTARVTSSFDPGVTLVDLNWQAPFADNSYFVLFPNPPFAPAAISPPPTPVVHTEAFTGTLSNNWFTASGSIAVDPITQSLKTVSSANDNRASIGFTDPNWGLNQYSEVQVTQLTGGAGGFGPAVYTTRNPDSYYGFYVDSNATYLFSQVDPTTTVFATGSATLKLNDVLRLEIAGNVLTGKINGNVVLVSPELVPIATGTPGIQSGGTNTFRLSNWEGGNLSSIPVTAQPIVLGPWTYLSNGTGIQMLVSNLNTAPLTVQVDVAAFSTS